MDIAREIEPLLYEKAAIETPAAREFGSVAKTVSSR